MVKISSESAKITKTVIERAWKERATGKRLIIRDKETAGLALLVNATTMTWSYSYRPRGKDPTTGRRWPNKPMTLGNPESLSVEDARHAAAALKGRAAAGDDPHEEMKKRRAAEAAAKAETVTRQLDLYAKALPKRPKLRGKGLPTAKHADGEIAHARAAVATMGIADLPVLSITASHLRSLLTAEAQRPATARHRFGAFVRFCDWLMDEGRLKVNPAATVGKNWRPAAVESRSRYPTTAELAALWKASADLSPVFRDLARFLICVPCRKNEATRLDWQHVDLAKAVWTQPGKMTKNGELHRLHLHPLALGLLEARHAAAGKPSTGLVFPAPRSGRPVDNFTEIKKAIDKEASFAAWTWHDFRRSFASVLGEIGLPEPVLDACLNHRQSATRGGVLGVYQRAQRWPEQVNAMKAWGSVLQGAIDGVKLHANVVQFPTAS